jgi:hypothetical protein
VGGSLGLFLARLNGTQNIAGLGDLGQINLWLGFRLVPDYRGSLGATLKMRTNPLGLICFEGAGVGLRFRNANFLQNIENLSAFDL